MAPTDRTGRRRRYPAVLATLAILALVAVWRSPPDSAGGPNPFRLERESTPEGPALLTSIRTELIWRPDVIPPTTITVRNSGERPAQCEVWWILAGQGEAKPWDHPVMQSTPVPVRLAPFTSRTVAVKVLAMSSTKAGVFALSAWAHCRRSGSGGWLPSDGATMNGGVEVLANSPLLQLSPATSRFFWVAGASAQGRLIGGRPGHVRVEVANAATEPIMVDVLCYLAPPGTDRPWADPEASPCQAVTVNLALVAVTTLDLTVPKLPPAGRYVLSVWVQQQRAARDAPRDGARLVHEVAVRA